MKILLAGIFMALGMLGMACQVKRTVADVVLTNGVIHTVDENRPLAQALGIVGDRLVFVGRNEEARKWIDATTQVIDLNGKTVVPGFIDSHYHFQGVGRRAYDLNLDGCTSLEEFLVRLKNWAANRQPGEWITGRGWMEEDWPVKQFPTREKLDRVMSDLPVYLNRADGHMAVVNSKALELAGITATTPNPPGGEILKDAQGQPNGLLVDNAMNLVSRHIPSRSPEMQERFALKANEIALAYGLTTIHDAGSSWETVELWKRLYSEGRMHVRIYEFIRGPGEEADRLLQTGPQIGLFDHHLTIRGIKIVIDGALGSRGAALLENYSDADTRGLFLHSDEEIYPLLRAATEKGLQVAIHAIGDAANRKVLDLYERADNEVPAAQRKISDPRFRIEHAQIVDPVDIPRFKKLGVIPSMQPSHAIGDLHFSPRRLGMKRLTGAYAWRTFLDQGCYIAGGSDAPVEEGNPMIEFYAAVTRHDTTGFFAEGWHPELRMTREEALKALTIWGAYAAFEEDLKGSLTPGKLADLVVVDRDLMTAPESELFRTKVLVTMVGGTVVFQNEQMKQFVPKASTPLPKQR
ncbi:MAG: amidohydrolase [candidate division KSB1 bacterium]|nr:amidohydrolase [candidate division KSB1 bacterium]MDZ7304519.1 amidohydrolase [candidate division KSB1 bacterium]MDZ7313899.1 amidohydrolase [candidate division KSB1 bacterium]